MTFTPFFLIANEQSVLCFDLCQASKSIVKNLEWSCLLCCNDCSYCNLTIIWVFQAATAQNEATRRSELEVEVKSLTAQVSKLTNVNAEMRIRDKNIQVIAILLNIMPYMALCTIQGTWSKVM